MSLQEPAKKMSKSDPNPNNFVGLLEPPKSITKKFKRAVTDSEDPPRIASDPTTKPGVSNLLGILSAITGKSAADLEVEFEGRMYGHLKVAVAEAVCATLAPVQERYAEIRADRTQLDRVMSHGAERARQRARLTVEKVYEAVGFVPLRD